MWREFWAEVAQPSDTDETPYQWAIIAAGHFLIGAGLAAVLPVVPWIIGLVYFAAKETRDLRNGGRIGDSIIDTLFVALGAACYPLLAVALIGAGVHFYRHVRNL